MPKQEAMARSHNLLFLLNICIKGLLKHLDGTLQTLDGFFLSEECRDVEHARTLAYTNKRKAECVHNVAQFVALILYPLHHDGLLSLDREVVYAVENFCQLAHNLG